MSFDQIIWGSRQGWYYFHHFSPHHFQISSLRLGKFKDWAGKNYDAHHPPKDKRQGNFPCRALPSLATVDMLPNPRAATHCTLVRALGAAPQETFTQQGLLETTGCNLEVLKKANLWAFKSPKWSPASWKYLWSRRGGAAPFASPLPVPRSGCFSLTLLNSHHLCLSSI